MEEKVKLPKQIAFSSLNAAERRVRIARDVLASLKAKRMRAREQHECGNPYISFILNSTEEFTLEDDARKVFARPCAVCAKGSLLIAAVDRFNKVKLQTFRDKNVGSYDSFAIDSGLGSQNWLLRFFSRKELAAMEVAFEGRTSCGRDSEWLSEKHSKLADRAVHFHHGTADERLHAIMKNIIKNKGTFKP